ncbi:MAG: hypothetical protein HS117_19540 [Verrucomicrobiaceae bacterium]|nr:hypothetical protein [Verrucomicrobiaceae bacterium]
MNPTSQAFQTAFHSVVNGTEAGAMLREASLEGKLGPWTKHLTASCVQACEELSLRASAKGHKLDLLPVARSEYLSLDVVAFPETGRKWRFPSLIAELENRQDFDFIAYSLWKILSVRAGLRVLFCYRNEEGKAGELVRKLKTEVIDALGTQSRLEMDGETLVVVGTRTESGTFPYGFFSWWRLNAGTGIFNPL